MIEFRIDATETPDKLDIRWMRQGIENGTWIGKLDFTTEEWAAFLLQLTAEDFKVSVYIEDSEGELL